MSTESTSPLAASSASPSAARFMPLLSLGAVSEIISASPVVSALGSSGESSALRLRSAPVASLDAAAPPAPDALALADAADAAPPALDDAAPRVVDGFGHSDEHVPITLLLKGMSVSDFINQSFDDSDVFWL